MGPVRVIYCTEPLSDDVLDAVHRLLMAKSEKVETSRQGGPVWDIWYPSPIVINVERPSKDELDGELDVLFNLDLLPEDVEYQVVLSAGCKGEDDRRALNELGDAISSMLSGKQWLYE